MLGYLKHLGGSDAKSPTLLSTIIAGCWFWCARWASGPCSLGPVAAYMEHGKKKQCYHMLKLLMLARLILPCFFL